MFDSGVGQDVFDNSDNFLESPLSGTAPLQDQILQPKLQGEDLSDFNYLSAAIF